jgi:hypothetical protein
MNAFHALIDRWGALVAGIVLLALLCARWASGAPVIGVDIVIGGVGVAALLLARAIRRKPAGVACPRCGEPLAEAA